MPVKRRLHKGREHRITEAAIEAWRAGDMVTLHSALGLYPHQASPLPLELCALGVDRRTKEQNAAMPYANQIWNDSWPQAQDLQRELFRVAGAPGEPSDAA